MLQSKKEKEKQVKKVKKQHYTSRCHVDGPNSSYINYEYSKYFLIYYIYPGK